MGGGGAPSLKKRKYGRADSAYFSRYGAVSAFTCQNLTLRPWYATYSFLNVDVIASLGPHHDANTSTMWSMSASKSASPWTLAHSASDVIGVIDTLSSLGGMVAAAGYETTRERRSDSRESRGQEEQRRSATDAFACPRWSSREHQDGWLVREATRPNALASRPVAQLDARVP